jgi:hypothetical protein
MTSRALNSHDVAAAMSPQNQVRILKTVLMDLQFILFKFTTGIAAVYSLI